MYVCMHIYIYTQAYTFKPCIYTYTRTYNYKTYTPSHITLTKVYIHINIHIYIYAERCSQREASSQVQPNASKRRQDRHDYLPGSDPLVAHWPQRRLPEDPVPKKRPGPFALLVCPESGALIVPTLIHLQCGFYPVHTAWWPSPNVQHHDQKLRPLTRGPTQTASEGLLC